MFKETANSIRIRLRPGCRLLVWLICGFLSFVQSGSASLEERRSPIVKAVQATSNSVVNISTEAVQRAALNPFFDNFFNKFFNDYLDRPGMPEEPGATTVPLHLGSGVVFDKDGYILTNEHVILKASSIRVRLSGEDKEYEAQLVGSDPDTDLAIIKIEKKNLETIRIGKSSDIMIGETVIAIGNPYGLSQTVTTGVVSALERSFRFDEDRIYRNLIQTDASINPGNSGGPLLNILGELIGINTAIHSKGQGIGFAIPVDRAKTVFEELLVYGEVHFAWIGILVQNLTNNLRYHFQYARNEGLLVKGVERNSPAHVADVMTGDILTKIAGKEIFTKKDFTDMLRNIRVGEKVVIELIRDGKQIKTALSAKPFPEGFAETVSMDLFGIAVNDWRGSGVVVDKIKRQSPAHRIGIQPGDVLRQIDSQVIKSKADYDKVMIQLRFKGSAMLAVQRNNQIYFVTINFYKEG